MTGRGRGRYRDIVNVTGGEQSYRPFETYGQPAGGWYTGTLRSFMNELLHSFFESISTSVNGVTRRTRLTAAADISPGWRRRGRVGLWDVERRIMGADIFWVEMEGREENLLGVGVGVVGRFCCSWVVVVVSSQPTEADRSRLKNL